MPFNHSFPMIFLTLSVLLWTLSTVKASDDCQPVTWRSGTKRHVPEVDDHLAKTPSQPRSTGKPPDYPFKPGDINCRYESETGDHVNYYTCTELAEDFDTDLDLFFTLNPGLKLDCSNIQPNTRYCVQGYIEPVTAWDGLCGPPHNNATCLGTDVQCCNAETWTCGDTEEDCAAGTCYEGFCYGDKIYSTDGTCGSLHGNRQCAGKWGNCCSLGGRCGTGQDFCGREVCASGDCEWKVDWNLPTVTGNATKTISATSSSSRTTSVSRPSSTTSSGNASATPPLGDCVQGTGPGGYLGLCDFSCHFGFCPSPCTCKSRGATPNPPPALTGDHGYAVAGMPANFGPLCEFTCSHNYCPSDVCRTTPPATAPGDGHDACVQGAGSGGYAGLCDFCCHYGYCPPGPCTCTAYGTPVAPPPETGTPGKEAPGNDASYSDLCSYACNHGYCPAGACVFS